MVGFLFYKLGGCPRPSAHHDNCHYCVMIIIYAIFIDFYFAVTAIVIISVIFNFIVTVINIVIYLREP